MITLYCCSCATTVTDCGSPFHGRWTKLENAERATRMACVPSPNELERSDLERIVASLKTNNEQKE